MRKGSSAATGDANSLECLDALLIPFLDPNVHSYRVTSPEGGNICTEPLFLGFAKGVHGILSAFSGTVSKNSHEREELQW